MRLAHHETAMKLSVQASVLASMHATWMLTSLSLHIDAAYITLDVSGPSSAPWAPSKCFGLVRAILENSRLMGWQTAGLMIKAL